MPASIFQSEPEFDRGDCQMRRTYLVIADAEVLLANMPELSQVEPALVRRSATCWQATGAVLERETLFVFRQGKSEITLAVHFEKAGVRIVDPKQDEWGGMGGFYEPVSLNTPS